jgi:hypothetical protein
MKCWGFKEINLLLIDSPAHQKGHWRWRAEWAVQVAFLRANLNLFSVAMAGMARSTSRATSGYLESEKHCYLLKKPCYGMADSAYAYFKLLTAHPSREVGVAIRCSVR